jgi:predicted cobalt transporter CbtA
MLVDHLRRGGVAGLVGGSFYGLFLWLVGRHLVALAERHEGASHGGDALSAAATVAGGVLWGVLLGVAAFGVAYYLLEPAVPGSRVLRSYLLGAAGFVTVSAAPWLVLPPMPPGVEQALSTETRLAWYGAMVVAGAVASGLALTGLGEARQREPRAVLLGLLAVAALAVPVLLAPANATSGPAPPELVAAFRWVSVFGQVALWFVMATVHALAPPVRTTSHPLR